jgi:CIC family chloride channel protein
VLGGLGAAGFVKLLLNLRAWFMSLPKRTVWVQPVAGGLLVGLIGYFLPEVMGVGYDYVERVLNGDIVLTLVVLFAVLKIVATAVCYASGNAGGIFGPSLFIGAMLGASVGGVAHHLFPQATAGPGAYALVGMGTAFAGIVRTPLTSVIMIFEITRDYTIIVPLMISNLIAFFISHRLQHQPIYEALAYQEGVHLPAAHSRDREERTHVFQAMQPPPIVLAPELDAAAALAQTANSPFDAWPVAGEREFHGMLRRADIEKAAEISPGRKLVELLREQTPGSGASAESLPHLHSDHSLSLALERMGSTGLRVLPVVSRANVHQLLGILALDDVLRLYGVGGGRSGGEGGR